MADRNVAETPEVVPEIPELLEQVLLFALDEGKEKMEQGGEVTPFTTLVVKENLFMESHPGDDAESCFAAARHTVDSARGADAYAFCYDGYVELDTGMQDVLIAEGGIPGEALGYAIGYVYNADEDGTPVFEEDPAFIGEAPNYMENLKDSSEYGEDDIDARYLEEDVNDGDE